jgi:hypothetical protein
MSIVLIVSGIVAVLGIASIAISVIYSHGPSMDGFFAFGLVALLLSLLFGFLVIGTNAPVKTEETLRPLNSNYTARAQHVFFTKIDDQVVSSDQNEIVTSPLEKLRVKKEQKFNSYGYVIETKYYIITSQ